MVEQLQVFANLSQDQSSKRVAATLAAQEAARKASEAADLQHEAASFHRKACNELRKITRIFSEGGPGAGCAHPSAT